VLPIRVLPLVVDTVAYLAHNNQITLLIERESMLFHTDCSHLPRATTPAKVPCSS
jgi:hypothetical protein